MLDDGEPTLAPTDEGHDEEKGEPEDEEADAEEVDAGACALPGAAEPVDRPSLASFMGSCCLMGSVLADIAVFCSFLALIRFMGSGMLLRLSRFRVETPGMLPTVEGPPETTTREQQTTTKRK